MEASKNWIFPTDIYWKWRILIDWVGKRRNSTDLKETIINATCEIKFDFDDKRAKPGLKKVS